jgi:flagellar motor switch protein FliM
MLDVLSQKEIDALVNSMNMGEAPPEEEKPKEAVKDYDFRTANKFTKEHIRTIEAVIKNFAHLLSNYFVGMLRTSCEIEVLSMEEMSFNEFHNSVPSLSVISVISMSPLEGSAIFEISKETACSIFSRVLGGSKSIPVEKTQFTEIEMSIMERVVWQILKFYDEAWGKMTTINSNLERMENSMQFAQVTDGNEAVLVATLNIQIGGESGLASFCLPREMMAPQLKKLNPRDWYTGNIGKRIEAHPDKTIHSLSNTFVEVSAVFNTTDARTQDILSLQAGDVIKLDHKVTEPLTILVQHLPKYKAVYGKKHGYYAAKIRSELKGDEQDE